MVSTNLFSFRLFFISSALPAIALLAICALEKNEIETKAKKIKIGDRFFIILICWLNVEKKYEFSIMNTLSSYFRLSEYEAGCDEAGRGCLAGPVFAAAVIFPKDFVIDGLDDSKKISSSKRFELAKIIRSEALSYSIAQVSPQVIDEINILNASILAMHKAIEGLDIQPKHLIIDGNRFKPYEKVPFDTIIKGDAKFQTIAAASILAKTERDVFMKELHAEYPMYKWKKNMGYPSAEHKLAISQHGHSVHHRKSFNFKLTEKQVSKLPH